MTYKQAIEELKTGCTINTRDDCVRVIHDAVAPLCLSPICLAGETSLHDWLCEGDWSQSGTTPEEIAAEWDKTNGQV